MRGLGLVGALSRRVWELSIWCDSLVTGIPVGLTNVFTGLSVAASIVFTALSVGVIIMFTG